MAKKLFDSEAGPTQEQVEEAQEIGMWARAMQPADQFPQYDGFYTGIHEDDYHELECCSNSTLGKVEKSPLHAKHAMESGSSKDTWSKRRGRLVHLGVLEPDRFEEEVVKKSGCEEPSCNYQGKYVVAGQNWCGNHKPDGEEFQGDVLKESRYDQVSSMVEAVHEHPKAAALLSSSENAVRESVALFPYNTDNGPVPCKARLDYFDPTEKLIVDVKTTRDASREQFSKSIWNYGYYRQQAFYKLAVATLTGIQCDYHIIAVEEDPPYAVVVYQMSESTQRIGERQCEEFMEQFSLAWHTGNWKGYGDDVQEISLPHWAVNKI